MHSAGYIPTNEDGEVERFFLMSIPALMDEVASTDNFKFNCNLVVIDFLIRHGFYTSDDPHYLAVCEGLRRMLPRAQGQQSVILS